MHNFSRLQRLWLSSLLDLFATGAWLVALPLITIQLDLGPQILGGAITTYLVGTLICLAFGGHVIDTQSTSRVMGTAVALTAVLFLILAVALDDVMHTLPVLLVISFLLGCADALFGPASEAIVPELVAIDTLGRANSLMSVAESVAGKIAGPGLAGVLLLTVGARPLLLILSVVSALAAVLAWSLHTPPTPGEGENPFRGLASGIRLIAVTRWLWLGLCWAALSLLFQFGARTVALPYRYDQSGDARLFSVGIAVLGIGALTGGLLMSRWGHRIMSFRAMMTLWIAGSLCWFVIARTTDAAVIAGALFVMGVFNSSGNVCWSTLLQARVPAGYRGRVASADWLVSISLMPVSTVLAGYVALNHASSWMLLAGIVPALLGVVLVFIVGTVSATGDEIAGVEDTEVDAGKRQ